MAKKKEDNMSILEAISLLTKDKNISQEMLIGFVIEGLTKAYKKNYNQDQNVNIYFDEKIGEFVVESLKVVVENVIDSNTQISVTEARLKNSLLSEGDIYRERVYPKNFLRVAAQTAIQVVTTKIKEAENNRISTEFAALKDTIVNAVVHRVSHGIVFFNIGSTEVMMLQNDQNPVENYVAGAKFKVVVVDVKNGGKGPSIHVSRTHPLLVKKLFEMEVPELQTGEVEIVSIAREAGSRTKIAVRAASPEIDAIGALIGPKYKRVSTIVEELRNEKIDIVEWDENIGIYISNALSPAGVEFVALLDEPNSALVVVPNDQLSLAIGKEGQNVRLAAKLTNCRIDIKDIDQYNEYMGDSDGYSEDDAQEYNEYEQDDEYIEDDQNLIEVDE